MGSLARLEPKNFGGLVARAAEILQAGGVIAYPTETLYGLGALAGNARAVERLRKIKGKAEPMLVLVSGVAMAKRYAVLDRRAQKIARKFWPGPLTLILKSKTDMLLTARGGSRGIGLRASSDPFAMALVEALGEPIISTSANRSGEKPLTSAGRIAKELGSGLDLVVNAGLRAGKASTLVDLSGPEMKLVREGALKFELIRKVAK
jgi:L-threonylcarbamoyladenylate synthase